MLSHRRAALVLSAALLSLLFLPASSFPFFRAAPHSSLDTWTSSHSLATRSREFAVVSDEDGIPQLEAGEKPAQDPKDILDKPVPANGNAPQTTSEIDSDVSDPVAQNDDSSPPEPSLGPAGDSSLSAQSTQPSISPEVPGSDGLLGPEAAVTVQPSPPEGQGSAQPNSQDLTDSEETFDEPVQSPEAVDDAPAPVQKPSTPSPSPSMAPSAKPSKSAIPSSSSSSLPLMSPVSGDADSSKPAISNVVSFSPKPPSAVVVPNTDAAEVTVTPDPDVPLTSSSSLGSPSPLGVPSADPSLSTTTLSEPSPSTIPEILEELEEEELVSPEASLEPAAVGNNAPNASPGGVTSNNVAVTAVPPGGSALGPSIEPASPPSSSATPATVVTAVVPQPPLSSPAISPTTPEVTAIVVPPAATPPPSASSAISASASPTPQSAGITAIPPAPQTEPDVTAVVPVPAGSPSSDPVTVPSASPVVQPIESPVIPSSSAVPIVTTVVSPPSPSPQSPGSVAVPGIPSSSGESGFTCVYFGAGSLPGFSAPEASFLTGLTSQFTVPQSQFPSLAPQYLSHTHGMSWSYAIPVQLGSAYDFVLGFAETYDVACASGPDAGYRKFEVAIGSQSAIVDVVAEVGCGKALKKTFSAVVAQENFLTVALQGFSQQAILNTMCFRDTSSTVEPPAQSPDSIPAVSSAPVSPDDAPAGIVIPDEDYQCVNFGPKVVGGYDPYNQEAVTGNTFLYRGSGVSQDSELPIPYRYHVYSKEWSYSLDVSTNTAQNIVLGFAEVYPKACASGSNGAFRVFTVSVAGGVRIVDAMKSAGCGNVEQVSFESISPKNGIIDVSFSSISGDAMLSVLCFKDVGPPSPLASQDPVPTAVVISPDPSPVTAEQSSAPNVSQTPNVPESPILESCFKFGDEIVDGFANVELGSGVELYNNPFAIVEGTDFDSVYATHVFGNNFKFSVQMSDTTTKSVILGFAEVFQPACKEGYRVFEIKAGTVTQTIDVYKEVGCNTVFDLRIDGLVPSSSGLVEISFSSVSNLAMLSAVCILDEGSSTVNNVLPSEIPDASLGTTSNSASKGLVLNVQVSGGDSIPMTTPPSGSPTQSPEQSPLTPANSPLPKENGVIIALPTETPKPSQESILIDLNVTSEDNGEVPSPLPSDMLLHSNVSQVTMGDPGESQSPGADVSPMASVTPSQLAVVGTAPSASPVPFVGPTTTPSVSFSTAAISPASPSMVPEDELGISTEPEVTAVDISNEDVLPTATPLVSDQTGSPVAVTTVPSVVVTAIPPGADFSGASPSNVVSPPPDPIVQASQEPVPSDSESSTSEPDVVTIPGSDDSEPPSEPLVTAIPPGGQFAASEESSSNAVVPSNDLSDGADWGGSTQSNQGVIIVPQTVSPIGSPSPLTLVPSPAGPPVIEVLPPVDDTPLPSVIPPSPPSQESAVPFPTVTPEPAVSTVASVSPVSDDVTATVEPESSVAPAPSATDDSPEGVVPGVAGEAAESPVTIAGTNPDASPAVTPSQIVSTTGTDEVITVASVAPSPDPQESEAVVAPPKPIGSVAENGTGTIEVTDGSSVSDDTVNPDASGTIVAGDFKELIIGTQPQGRGFSIGMGILGALLVLLLLVCLFFAIFRSTGGAYSYSSQYSAHKPTDYGDPSQGGYTEELAPGAGGYGDAYSYGQGAQDGYGGGTGTFESRAQNQTGSFTYEGADDTLGAGSGYGTDVAGGTHPGGGAGSTYANTEPDTFAEYASLNMQRPSGYEESQGPQTGDYTFTDTFTMPNKAGYPLETQDMTYDEYRDPGPATTETEERAALRASDSFNAYHSSARPMTQESESSGKEERNTASPRVSSQRYSAAHQVEMRGVSKGASEGTQRSDGRDSSQQILSISSNPTAVQSPYESNFEVPDGIQDHSGNVYKGNSSNLRTMTSRSKRVFIHEKGATRHARADTDADDNFLCNDYSAPPIGTGQANAGRWGTLPTQEARAVRSQVSDDGPWPSWWSDRKKLTSTARAGELREQKPAIMIAEEDVEDSKENGTLSSTAVTRALFQSQSQPYSPGESDKVESVRPVKPVTPLAVSSKANVMVVSSHIQADAKWRRMSIAKSAATYEEEMHENPDFEELRRRRQPYVKSVASRLSVGLHSISTSMSAESALGTAVQEYEDEMKLKSEEAERTSSSWIRQRQAVVGT